MAVLSYDLLEAHIGKKCYFFCHNIVTYLTYKMKMFSYYLRCLFNFFADAGFFFF